MCTNQSKITYIYILECVWKGIAGELEQHLKFCLMNDNKIQEFLKKDLNTDITQKLSAESSLLSQPNEELKNFLRSNQSDIFKLIKKNFEKNPDSREKINLPNDGNIIAGSKLNLKEQNHKAIPLNVSSNINTSANINSVMVSNKDNDKNILNSKSHKLPDLKSEEAKIISNNSIQNKIKITFSMNRDKKINSVPKISPESVKNNLQLTQNFPKNASNEIKCHCGNCNLYNKENIKKEVVNISKFPEVESNLDDAE